MGAIVLSKSHVNDRAIVAAGAVVPEGGEVRPGTLVMGIPARERRELSDAEIGRSEHSAAHYVANGVRYRATLQAVEREEGAAHGD
ncbi:MAG: gamma carbonic anhydrase family protein, partial [Thermomicrobiales bacterium]